MFIGRSKELKELNEKLSNDRFESILICGRRRIGKTELIKEAAKNFKGDFIYFEAFDASLGTNLSSFNEMLGAHFGMPLSFSSFREALRYIFKYSFSHKTLLVLDEFPFLLKWDPTFSSLVRDLVDEYSKKSMMKFILSGSYVETMKSLNDGKSETYGRFTGIIELKPFDYYESSLFYPSYSNEEKILMYSCFGGVAFFNSLVDTSKSALENIKGLILRSGAILQLEVENLISGEIGKISSASSVIFDIANGIGKYSDLLMRLRMREGAKASLEYPLKKLIDLEIVRKVSPINDPNNKKRTFYRFADNLLEFYYRFIFRYKSRNSILEVDDFYEAFVKNDLEKVYLPKKFEEISGEFLLRKSNRHELKPLIYEIGTYSHDDPKGKKNVQFDLVTLDEAGYISYECKYSERPVGLSIIEEEKRQTLASGLNVYKLGFVSKSGFEDGLDKDEYNLFSLDEFYN